MITQLLRSRSSARRFEDRPVPDDVLAEILEAGRLSPSGGNEQPWIFGVVTDRDLIGQIAEAAHGQTWIAHAPLLIVLCVTSVTDARGGVTSSATGSPGTLRRSRRWIKICTGR